MATELPTEGYTDLQTYIIANWTYIALCDSAGAEKLRILTSDDRCSWSAAGTNPITLTVVIHGSDADITLPTEIAESKLYKVASAGDVMSSDTHTVATLGSTDDVYTLTHAVQIPQI